MDNPKNAGMQKLTDNVLRGGKKKTEKTTSRGYEDGLLTKTKTKTKYDKQGDVKKIVSKTKAYTDQGQRGDKVAVKRKTTVSKSQPRISDKLVRESVTKSTKHNPNKFANYANAKDPNKIVRGASSVNLVDDKGETIPTTLGKSQKRRLNRKASKMDKQLKKEGTYNPDPRSKDYMTHESFMGHIPSRK